MSKKDEPQLTHLDNQGHARMVDVGGKPDTRRIAIARGEVQLSADTLKLILSGRGRRSKHLRRHRLRAAAL